MNYNSLANETLDSEVSSILSIIRDDALRVISSGQLLLSTYAPLRGKPVFPGFENKSFEEVRLGFYEATEDGSLTEYKQEIKHLFLETMEKMKALIIPSEEVIHSVIEIYKTPSSTETNTPNSLVLLNDRTFHSPQVSNFKSKSLLKDPIPPFKSLQQQKEEKSSKHGQIGNVIFNTISNEEDVNSKSEILSAIDTVFKSNYLPLLEEIKQQLNTCTESLEVLKFSILTTEKPFLKKQIDDHYKNNSESAPESIRELEERVKRANNVIIYNIPESNNPDPTSRKCDDIEYLKRVLSRNNTAINIPETSLLRIGKVGINPRPIKLHFNNTEDASGFIKMCNKFKINGIRVGPDHTPLQSKLLKEARIELMERRSFGQKDLRIKFIKGQPRVITKT